MIEVLLASYNGEKYIGEQLESILNQTYSDFRILVRDDGSSDNTLNIIRDYMSRYPNKIILIQDEIKCGSSASNFMELVKHATADYVCFSDQDDFWFQNKLDVSLKEIELLQKRVGEDRPCLVFGDYIPADDNLNVLDFNKENNQVAGMNLDFNRLLVQNYVTGCLMMVNKPLYKLMGDYSVNIEMHDWWAALLASSLGGIKHFECDLMKYRQHGNNVVGVTNVKSAEYRINKFLDKDTKNKKYSYYNQAMEFKTRYQDILDKNNNNILNSFIEIDAKKYKIQRIRALIKGKYLKSDLVRQIGQIWYV